MVLGIILPSGGGGRDGKRGIGGRETGGGGGGGRDGWGGGMEEGRDGGDCQVVASQVVREKCGFYQ